MWGVSGIISNSFRAHHAPILRWGQAVFTDRYEKGLMFRLIRQVLSHFGKIERRNIWRHIASPAHAFVATAWRIGWVVESAVRMAV